MVFSHSLSCYFFIEAIFHSMKSIHSVVDGNLSFYIFHIKKCRKLTTSRKGFLFINLRSLTKKTPYIQKRKTCFIVLCLSLKEWSLIQTNIYSIRFTLFYFYTCIALISRFSWASIFNERLLKCKSNKIVQSLFEIVHRRVFRKIFVQK